MKKEKYKISKKVMLLTIAVLTVFTSFSGNFLNLHADFTVNVTGMNATGYTHRGQACSGYNCAQFYGQSIDKLTLSDGRVGFCIEPHLLVNGGNGYSGSEINDEALGKIVYHGYLNTGQSMYDYAVTQLMIWELKGYVPTSHTVPNYANRKAEIQNAINSHYTNLSFNNTSHTVNVNESITLTDTNNVLSQFKNWKADGCDISVNGNQLTIIPRENASDNVVLRADKYKTQYVGASYIYRKANSQAIGSYYLHDPIPFKINLKVNKYGSLNIVKKDEDGNTVPNTSFTLSYNADMSNPIGTYTTGGNGAVKIDQLLPQTVYYQEVGVPSHLVLDNTIRSITIVPNDTIEVQATNKWVVGTIQVVKKDAETGKTIVRDNTTFSVYKQDGTFIQDIVTNNQGVAKLKLRYGQYYLKEKTAPSKYTKSEETIYYNVNADGQTFSAEMKDTRTKGSIILKKVDKETSDNPQGDSIFQGAVYGLYARENILDPADNSVIYTKDTKIAERITKADGTMDSIDNLYLGKYYVKELQAPIGYELDTTEINVILSYANQNVPVVVENATSKEQVKTGSFSLEKGIANSNDSEIMKPEENAKFITVLKKYVEQYGDIETAWEHRNEFSKREYAELVTDKNGYAKSPQLAYGIYVSKQIEGQADTNLLSQTWETEIKGNGEIIHYLIKNQAFLPYVKLIKQDSETGELVTFSNTTFKVWDYSENKYVTQKVGDKKVSEFTTENGYVVMPLKLKPGKYRLEEKANPDGYTINEDGVDFTVTKTNVTEKDEDGDFIIHVILKNDRITGKIELTKTGEKLTGTKTDNKGNIDFVYEQKGLANTTYTLYANEDIISSINGKVLFKKNEKVQEKTSDEQGKIVFDKLELGSYYLQETQAETGYVLDDSKIDVVLTKKDNHTKLIVEDVKASNTRQKVDLSVFKKDSMTDKGLQGVKLATYLKEDLYSYDNTLLLEKGTKIETRTSDEKGYVNFKADYPFIKLEVKELETIEGYYLSDKVLDVNVKYQGQEKAIAKIEKEFANDIIQSKGNLIWNKTGYVFMDTEEIESEYGPITKPVYEKQNILGAEIEVYTAEDIVLRNGVKVLDKDTKVDTLESDFELTKSKDLHSGKYYYIESKVPTNYVGNSEKHYFTIEDSKTTDLTQTSETLYNPSPTIKVNFTKTLEQDSNTTGNEYKQVRYGLYTRDDTYNYMGEVKLPYNTLVDVLKIDENGNFINFPKHLPVGNYYVKELQTDNAYKIDLNEYDFEVTQTNDETYEIEINKNEPVKNVLKDYTLQLQKVDSETKQAIVNNGFEFTRYADKDCTEEIATGTLNLEKGTIMFNSVHYGVTYLKETQAPTGYEISDKVIKVEINDEGVFIDDEKIENEDDVYSFVVENKKIPETKEVETGDTSNPTLYLGLMGMSCIALSGVLMCRNKKKERGK